MFSMLAYHLAAPHRELPPDQVHSLYPVGAFVDGCDTGVPIVLGDARLLHISHAAEYLDGEGSEFHTEVGRPCFGQRRQQICKFRCLSALLLIGVVECNVHGLGVGVDQRAHCFDVRTLGHEHSPHIGVLDDE